MFDYSRKFVFISWSSKDRERVFPIVETLNKNNVNCWINEKTDNTSTIDGGTDWGNEIGIKINECETLLVFLTNNYLNSSECQAELKYYNRRTSVKNIISIQLDQKIDYTGHEKEEMILNTYQYIKRVGVEYDIFIDHLLSSRGLKDCTYKLNKNIVLNDYVKPEVGNYVLIRIDSKNSRLKSDSKKPERFELSKITRILDGDRVEIQRSDTSISPYIIGYVDLFNLDGDILSSTFSNYKICPCCGEYYISVEAEKCLRCEVIEFIGNRHLFKESDTPPTYSDITFKGVGRDSPITITLSDNSTIKYYDLNSDNLELMTDNFILCPQCRTKYVKKGTAKCSHCLQKENEEREKFQKLKERDIKPKIERLQNFFANKVQIYENNQWNPYTLDEEQVKCIAFDDNTLVEARAGSGKTRTLVAKIIELIEIENFSDDELLTFCFNKNAAQEIRNRLKEGCRIFPKNHKYNVKTINTFHSFAGRVLNIKNSGSGTCTWDSILYDKKGDLIKALIMQLYDNDNTFRNSVMEFFRAESLTVDGETYQSQEAFVEYLKTVSFQTLNNESVESREEKYIADYLLEHGVDYTYFSSRDDNARMNYGKFSLAVCSSFNLYKNKTCIEYWTEKNEIGITNSHQYWAQNKEYNGIVLDESDYKNCSKDYIEEKLDKLLSDHNIQHSLLSDEEIIQKVWKAWKDDFCDLMDQYINRYQCNFLDSKALYEENLKNTTDIKVLLFNVLGMRVYQTYLRFLQNNNDGEKTSENFYNFEKYKLDGNQLIYEATKSINEGEFDSEINGIKWILIDEFQDFSKLFYNLIDAIRSRNNKIKFFCVGDPWQAINRFAGADVKYFERFQDYFPNSVISYITNNYRSSRSIVEYANRFMKNMGIEGKPAVANKYLYDSDRVKEIDLKFEKKEKYTDIYDWVNACCDQGIFKNVTKVDVAKNVSNIKEILNADDGSTLILSRKKKYLGVSFKEVTKAINEEFSLNINDASDSNEKTDNNKKISTVHVQKGAQADIVIIVDVKKGGFPCSNNREAYFTPFDPSNDAREVLHKAFIDEVKVYYVALTRAKEKEYIFFDSKYPSMFKSVPRRFSLI